MSDKLVTLATYRFAAKAEMAQALLQDAGIQAFVADTNVVTADWFLGNAIGYVKLQVPESQAEAALQICREHPQLLDEKAPAVDDGDTSTKCLACGEAMAEDDECCAACGWSYEPEQAEEADSAEDDEA